MEYLFVENDISPVVSALSERSVFSLDTETTGLSPFDSRILLVQISTPETNFVMRPSFVDMRRLTPFLRDPHWTKIIQNAVFEQRFFKYVYNTDIVGIFDT